MIIKSLLSTDLYKLTMLNVFFQVCPNVSAKYKFKCRNKDVNLLQFKEEIEKEIDNLCNLNFTVDELIYLSNLPYFDESFINYLEDFKLKRRFINVGEKDGDLSITMEGPITAVSPFEIYILKIVHEVYSMHVNPPNEELFAVGRSNLRDKIMDVEDFVANNGYKPKIVDFGGRRAYSLDWHEFIVKNLVSFGTIIGTSDIDLARRYNINPIGSMAHEFCMLPQAFNHLLDSQKAAFELWLDFYENDLGILLSDTLGDRKLLIDLTKDIANRSSGLRHDSGCPFQFGEMILTHYNTMGINPMTKTLVFSDGLDFPKMFELEKRFHGRIKTTYGIGTNLTNCLGITPLQNVIKLVSVDNKPVIKLSNDIGKSMCEDLNYFNYVKNCLDKL